MTDEKRKERDKEVNKKIMLAMFLATNEQSQYMTNQYQHQAKADFNLWQKLGLKMIDHFEKSNPGQYAEIESIADQYHEINKHCKQLI